jgi:xanthine phosphoribosyltransferase
MQSKTFDEVLERFGTAVFDEDFDMIVAIANGGIIPAAILNQRLEVEIQLLKINLRDSNQQPKYGSPKLLSPIDFEFKNKTILLVDDRIKTGASLRLAVELLQGARLIKTFAVNGNADYALYDEECFRFPWIIWRNK